MNTLFRFSFLLGSINQKEIDSLYLSTLLQKVFIFIIFNIKSSIISLIIFHNFWSLLEQKF